MSLRSAVPAFRPARAARPVIAAVAACCALLGCSVPLGAADAALAPTSKQVHYGQAERQVLDFWQAPGAGPAPVVLYIHGGGWVDGDKKHALTGLRIPDLLAAGISVAAMNYRYIQLAQEAKVDPPVQWPLMDAARAVQFLRNQATEWRIDAQRIAAAGASAGGCSALWLALHADLAQPASADPLARQSTRLACAAVFVAQTTLDPQAMREWTPNSRYGGHAFGLWDPQDAKSRDTRFADFLAQRERLLTGIREYSPIEHASPDDPPIYLSYRTKPALGKSESDPTHSANFGVRLQGRLAECKVPCELVYPGAAPVAHATVTDFLIAQLTAPVQDLKQAPKQALKKAAK